MRPLLVPVARELGRAVALLTLMAVSTSVLLAVLSGGDESIAPWQLPLVMASDADGLPIAPRFLSAIVRSIGTVVSAGVALGVASLLLGAWFALRPAASGLRVPLTLVSAVPAFLWPHLLGGFDWFAGPAVFLALGDLNLATLANQCYESLRRELNQPYLRTSWALGLSRRSDLWPRAIVIALDGVRARLPHLLGGTLAIELVYGIHGVGFLVFDGVMSAHPDYRVLAWATGFGIAAVRAASLIHQIAAAFLTPQRTAGTDVTSVARELSLRQLMRLAGTAGDRPPGVAGASGKRMNGPDPIAGGARGPTEFGLAADALPGRPSLLERGLTRLRALWLVSAVNRVKLISGGAWIGVAFALACVIAFGPHYSLLDTTEPHEAASQTHLLGTNGVGEDVLTTLALGATQLGPPIGIVVTTALVVGGLLGAVGGLSLRGVVLFDLCAEMVESIPKLMLVLAAITYFEGEGYAVKLYAVIGLTFAPLVYWSVREEVALLRRSVFLEASLALGVAANRVFWRHIVWRHCLPTLLREGAAMIAYVLLFDAILGFAGVRQYGEVFTWGSLLGTGLEEQAQFEGTPLRFNRWVLWGPLVAVLVAITLATLVSDMLKSASRSIRGGQ